MRVSQHTQNQRSFVQNDVVEKMSNQQLHDLVYEHQRFLQTVQQLNEQAQSKINSNQCKQALVYLSQAQQILQYAASCGKNIDRSIIISVLHNEACANQKSWELLNCSNYLQALILNLNEYLKIEEPKTLKKNSISVSNCSYNFMDKVIRLVKYHLQYAAINSQLKNHKNAFESSKKAIGLLKQSFKSLKKSFKSERQSQLFTPYESREQSSMKCKIIESVSSMGQDFNIQDLEDYISSTQYFYHIWQKNKSLNECQTIQQTLKKFSIGTIMQIVCDSQEEKKDPEYENVYFNTSDSIFSQSKKYQLLKNESFLKVLQKILIMSVAFFTAGTQLRLYSNEKYKLCPQTWKNSPQFKESQIFHLCSLMVVFAYVPFEMQFINHIINSYHKNYRPETQLFKEDNIDLFEKGVEQIIKFMDPLFIHLLYNNKKNENSKKKDFFPRKSSGMSSQASNSKSQKSPGAISKLQKKCKHIINKKYIEPEQFQIRRESQTKSFTYMNKKRIKTAKSQKSKKSFSVSKRDNLTNYIKLQDYFSPKKGKKKNEDHDRTSINKIKGYYDTIMPIITQKSTKLHDVKSTGKTPKVSKKKKVKSKIFLKASLERNEEKIEKSGSTAKSIKGGIKSMKGLVLKSKGNQKSTNRTPQRCTRREGINEYYS